MGLIKEDTRSLDYGSFDAVKYAYRPWRSIPEG